MVDNKSREEILEKRCSDYEDEIDEHIQKIIELEKNIDDLKSERHQLNNEVSSLFKRVNRLSVILSSPKVYLFSLIRGITHNKSSHQSEYTDIFS